MNIYFCPTTKCFLKINHLDFDTLVCVALLLGIEWLAIAVATYFEAAFFDQFIQQILLDGSSSLH